MSPAPKVPWCDYGVMLREIAVANPLLIEVGLRMPNKNITVRYFDWLQRKGLIRLKTSAEIMAQEPQATA